MLPPRLQEILEELDMFPDRAERIQALIELGEEFRNPSEAEFPRTPDRRVPGCESEAFALAEVGPAGTVSCRFAVDNPQGISAMALAKILEEGIEGASAADVASIPEDLVYRIFGNELSMGKSLGLTGMIRMVKVGSAKSA